MFIMNGIVYGGEPGKTISVEAVKVLQDKIMLITFSTGETRLFDASLLCGGVFERLNDKKTFESATVDHGVITWANGEIDCAPEFMYENSFEYPEAITV